MPHEYLSDEQIARYGRFPEELSVGDLEQCFRLTPDALALASSKRTPATRLGWAVQWGTVRMLGVFQPDHPTSVPERAVAFVADQLGTDPGCLPEYRSREKTAYEHAWQIRDTFGYREFSAGEEDLRAYLGARVWASEEGPRALYSGRAVGPRHRSRGAPASAGAPAGGAAPRGPRPPPALGGGPPVAERSPWPVHRGIGVLAAPFTSQQVHRCKCFPVHRGARLSPNRCASVSAHRDTGPYE